MKLVFVAMTAALISGVFASYFTYTQTRTKWQELGRKTGEVQGKAEVMTALCKFAEQGKPPVKAGYVLAVKANQLSAVQSDSGLKLYCE
jgi:hypothetical protein